MADDDSQFSEKYEELKKEHETLKQKLFEKEDELFNLNRWLPKKKVIDPQPFTDIIQARETLKQGNY